MRRRRHTESRITFRIQGRLRRRALQAALLASLAACQTAPPSGPLNAPPGTPDAGAGLAPFSTDGCSRFPDRSPGGGADWCGCCVAHDLAYWRGGSAGERLEADRALRSCVSAASHSPLLSRIMYAGVRLAGGPYLPTSFRWGYGWPYGRAYQPLDEREEAQVTPLRDAYLARNRTLTCSRDAH
ncbi:hypothetical protein ABIB42_005001 [Massilia sp. UYP32]|jgi:hypothetical protein|uniref:DUF1353 domain-containing protein n=1 Tax=Massilia TaxID=149698 RepID=UPI001C63424D|nr:MULTISPECIES: DUF1353 domain-containing protein [Massilia]QYG02977.1 DUF1353 domain-containing protein [Massilia sp. NP310]